MRRLSGRYSTESVYSQSSSEHEKNSDDFDTLIFKYASEEHKNHKDTTNGKFVISLQTDVLKWRDDPLFSWDYIDLTNEYFWLYVAIEKTDICKNFEGYVCICRGNDSLTLEAIVDNPYY